jgi:hypothetical protein
VGARARGLAAGAGTDNRPGVALVLSEEIWQAGVLLPGASVRRVRASYGS